MIGGKTDRIVEETHERIPIHFCLSILFPKKLFLSITEERVVDVEEVVSGVWGLD